MSGSIRTRSSIAGSTATLRLLIDHPMQVGLRDEGASAVEAHYITELTIEHAGHKVLHADWGQGIARNPFLLLRLRDARKGDAVTIRWHDNRGASDELVTTL